MHMNQNPVSGIDKDLADPSQDEAGPGKVSESRWGVLAVSLAVLGMLVAFYSVVRGATTAGEQRRQDTAARAAAVARCQAQPNGLTRKHCPMSPIVVAAQ